MLLGLRSDGSVAELYLCTAEGAVVAAAQWEAGRELAYGLLKKIDEFLTANSSDLKHLDGLIVFRGPGSFTGLRIGLTVMNTLAYAEAVPIVGGTGAEWLANAAQRVTTGQNDQIVLPFYGAEARITRPRK